MKNMTRISRKMRLLFLVVVFILANLNVFNFKAKADDAADTLKSIDKTQNKLEDVMKQLDQSKAEYSQNQTQIYSTKDLINKTVTEISRKETEISNLEKRIELNHNILSSYIQEMYYSDQDAISTLLLEGGNFDGYFGNFDQVLNAKEKVLGIINEVKNDQVDLSDAKVQLADKKSQHEKLLAQTQAEQVAVAADIQDAKTTIAQLSAKLDKLRSRYSEILGISVSTKDVVEAATSVAKSTGINKSFLLAVLIQESNKGQSTGSCDYKQSKMPSSQLTAFKSICKSLGYDYTKKKVSCPPKSYKGTGGAMGVPQFMPTTWQGWSSRIASATGHKTPDPWNLVDGVAAMALKLSADGADSKKRFDEAKSYCVYLAGGNWGHYCYGSASKYKNDYQDVNCWGTSIKNYGEKVLCLKDNYEKYY